MRRQGGRVTRREVLEWLGRSATLALGADLVSLSRSLAGPVPDADDPRFEFRPGELPPDRRAGWPVRTVDPQDLSALLARWRLAIDGLVDRPRTYSFPELLELPLTDQVTDFHCVEGWSVDDVPWTGVGLGLVLDRARVRPGATHVNLHTAGGKYNESLPLAVAREPRTLLAYGAVGRTLPLDHGFPLRAVIPRLLGYKNAKHVERIELSDRPLSGFWVAAGYPYGGEVPAARLRPGKF
ncbi:MAG: molybdopterin-dependent oxidoreductase [Deltaproteobacteria bacterium]|nr:molybdopterin-dependent oxidoreductase [Deltaproteobacteria bacterium]